MNKATHTVEISELKPEWIAEVAAIHMQSLPDDFLPGLGAEFLQKVFYPAAMRSPYGRVFVAAPEGRPSGFVVVTTDSTRFFRSIVLREFWGFVKTGLRTSFTSWKHFKCNFEVLASLFEKSVDEDLGEIYEIAVSPDRQNQGTGKALVARSIEYLKAAGVPGIKIKTRKDNTSWIGFFLKSGWHLAQEIHLIGKDYVVLSLRFLPKSLM